jgi:hypothetical protein
VVARWRDGFDVGEDQLGTWRFNVDSRVGGHTQP